MANGYRKPIDTLSPDSEKEFESKIKRDLLFVAAVDIEGKVSYFLPKNVQEVKDCAIARKAKKLLENDAISYVVFEGGSRHSRIVSGGTQLHIRRS